MSLLEDERKAEEREKAIANERVKISATYVNGLAIAIVAVGVLSPAVSAHPTNLKEALVQGAVGAVCLIGSGILHYIIRRSLGDLR